MIDKLIIDNNNIELSEKDKFPYNYQFSTAKTHNVKYALSETNEISAGAFSNCAYMTNVKFPPEITMIKRRAFENCSRLNNITIPKTIQYIGANVWDGCTGMKEIHFEHTGEPGSEIPSNFSEMPANCVVYIPNDSKYIKVEKDEYGKNMNMNPDSVDYYTKTKYNMYEYVSPRLLNDNDEYYYDAWTSIAPNNQTVEEKNKIPINSVDFETTSSVTGIGELLLKYSITPSNATNRQLYFFSSLESEAIKIKDDTVEGELLLECNSPASTTITVYAESGASAFCNIRVVQ